MLCIIHETQYFGPIDTWRHYLRNDIVLWEAHENYQKKSYRNRANILGANGPITLNVPLKKGKNNQTSIKEVAISYEVDWSRIHLQTIQSAYGSAPYFDHYFENIVQILTSKHSTLYSLNAALNEWLFKALRIDIEWDETSDFIKNYGEEILDYRNKSSKIGITPEGLKNKYPQVFEESNGFTPNPSILDLLFCAGPESRLYLKASE